MVWKNESEVGVFLFPETVEQAEAEFIDDMRIGIRDGWILEYAILKEVRYLLVPKPFSEVQDALMCYYASPQKAVFYVADFLRISEGARPQLAEWREPEPNYAIASTLPPMFVGLYARESYRGN